MESSRGKGQFRQHRGRRVVSIASIGGKRGGLIQSKRRATRMPTSRLDFPALASIDGGTVPDAANAATVVRLMGGEIVLDREPGMGGGISMTARVPRQADAAAEVAPPAHFRGARALIVDKDVASRATLERLLRAWNMEPTAVGDGIAAMDALWHGVASGRPYELAILDARTGEADALTLAAKIRDRAELSATPVVVLEAEDRPQGRARRSDAQVLNAHASSAAAAPARQPAQAAEPGRAGDSLSVLVAEDNELSAQLCYHLLARLGHTVRIVSDGREAVEQISRTRFDVLLLDLHMPDMDGFQVIRFIRDRERGTGEHLPVIALTARTRTEDRERALASGVDEFLAKPFRACSLSEAILRVVGATAPIQHELIDASALSGSCGGGRGPS